ncbi:FAD-dependent oxidoreductase [Altererythrobacter endophyticus]|uniref:FAD-dependent oxidoreductase n=2 Tax=Altericroceibacterium endophyticum TaxID=1808508 RepID=A0A6I4T3T2_9SPHN|nr:FAD-dependent oxidoreductase [Altericroceibacterium endophyticum]
MADRPAAEHSSNRPLWAAIAPELAAHAALGESLRTDIAIIGGGLAGMSSALHLSKAGAKVAVVEAATIGSGAAVASAGVIAPQLVRTTPSQVLAKLGAERGDGLLRMIAESGNYLFGLINDLGIDCDARNSGFVAPSASRNGQHDLAEVKRQWVPYRHDLKLLDGHEFEALTGCRGYSAALLDRSGGSVDPLAFARGLAAQAVKNGATIFENTPALSIVRDGAEWIARTPNGELRAGKILLAANGGNNPLHKKLAGTTLPLPVIEVATNPVSDAMRASILPEGQALTDLETDVFSLRYADGNRLITAFPANGDPSDAVLTERVNERLRAILTHYEPVKLDYIWRGIGQVNSDMLPRIVSPDQDMIAIQACNGRGIGINTLIGREVAKLLTDSSATPLITPQPPKRISGYFIARYVPSLMMSGARAVKRIKQKLRL